MTQEEAQIHKRQFNLVLRPILEMLDAKKDSMAVDDWSASVIAVERRIINNPDQYIGRDLPNINIVVRLIKEIFEDYLNEHLDSVE